MKTVRAFDIGIPGYSVHQLLLEDSIAVQALLEKCLDYALLVDGRPAGPGAGEEEFLSVPPGRSHEDKFLFGIVNRQDELVGVLDALCWYPDEATWWIGLLLFVPEIRSLGMGQKTVQGFAEYVRASGGHSIMLGVVEENGSAYNFWIRMGFDFVSKTEPRQFGVKTQAVIVMRKELQTGD